MRARSSVGPRPILGEHGGVATPLHHLLAEPQLVVEPAQAELAAEDADRARDRGRLGYDRVRRHGDVVPARGGHVPHRDDHGLRLAGQGELPPDHLGGGARASRAVHPQYDPLDVGVVARLAYRPGQGRGAGEIASERAALALPPDDLAHGIDDGHLRPAVEAVPARRPHVAAGGDALLGLQPALELVLVDELVHEPRVERARGDVGPAVEQLAHAGGRLLAAFRDGLHVLTVEAVDERGRLLAVRSGEAFLRELVGGVLVLAHSLELGLDPQLVQGPAKERDLGAEPVHEHERLRHRVDLAARGGEVVLRVAGGLQVRVRGLARLAEAGDRVPQLLHLPPAAREPAHPDDDSLDLGIDRRPLQALDDSAERGRARLEERVQLRIGLLGELAVEGDGEVARRLPQLASGRPLPRSTRASAPMKAAPRATAATPATRIQTVRFFTLAFAQEAGCRRSTRRRASGA